MAKYVAVDTGLWVVNGVGDTCIVQAHGGAVSCVSRRSFLKTGTALGVVKLGPPPQRKPQEFIVSGIVPDQITAVDLLVGDRVRRFAIHSNSYSLRARVPVIVKRFER